MNTKDLKNRQNINRINAWKYFYPEGNGKAKKGYVLHHKDKTLINTDVDRYLEWRIEDLVMLTNEEHSRFHMSGENNHEYGKTGILAPWYGRVHTDEEKQKISEAHKGKIVSEETKLKISNSRKGITSPRKGCHLSEETKQKLRMARLGKHLSDDTKNKIKNSWNNYSEEKRESIRQKLSASSMGNKYCVGKHPSEETRNKLSESHKGLLCGDKNPMYGKCGDKNPMYGRHHTEEAKRKMREAKQKKNNSTMPENKQ